MQNSERLLLLLAGFFFGAVFGALVHREFTVKEPVPPGVPTDPAFAGQGPMGRGGDAPAGDGSATNPAGGDPKAMMDVMTRLTELKKQPEKYENQVELGRMYLTVGKFPQAREWLEKAHAQQPRTLEVMMDLAVCRLRTDDVAGAEALFNAALKLDARNLEAMYGLATIAWGARKDSKGALGWLDKIDALKPGLEDSAQLRMLILQGGQPQVAAPPPAAAGASPH